MAKIAHFKIPVKNLADGWKSVGKFRILVGDGYIFAAVNAANVGTIFPAPIKHVRERHDRSACGTIGFSKCSFKPVCTP
jgi:hypothetical protein